MAKRDFYETLGVDQGVDESGLKSAYRKLAMRYHPDRNPDNPGAEKKFKEINEAYDVLKDPQKRTTYDRFGHEAFEGGMAGQSGAGFEGFGGFADVFEEMFGGGGRSRRGQGGSRRGADLQCNLAISLEEAFTGHRTELNIPTSATCDSCDGSGAEGGSRPVICGVCQGTGNIRAHQGVFMIQRTCHNCGGAGQVIERPCRPCRGSGRIEKDTALEVDIPAGVDDGTRIRLSGKGEAGMRGAPPGDLYIVIAIEKHPIFRRDGANLFCDVPVMMTTAALGGQIDVPTVEGVQARISINQGTQTGAQFRLRGKGMTVLRSAARGDLYVTAAVETPMNLSRQQKQLLEEFSETQIASTSPQTNGFFNRVKEMWGELKDG